MKKVLALVLFCTAPFCILSAQNLQLIYQDLSAVIDPNFPGEVASAEPGFKAVLLTSANGATFARVCSPNIVALVLKMIKASSPLLASMGRVASISNGHVHRQMNSDSFLTRVSDDLKIRF